MPKRSAISIATCIAAVLLQTPYSGAQPAPVDVSAGIAGSPGSAGAADAALARSLDASIGANYKASDPGIVVLVARDGKPLLRKAYGMANLAQQQALAPDMSLRLGSITKQFTAVAILMLAEEGKLSLQDDIRKHLPDYPGQEQAEGKPRASRSPSNIC